MADATFETIERRIESMDRRLSDLERAGATREELADQLRQFSERLTRMDQNVSAVPVLGQKIDELSRIIHEQDKQMGVRIDKLEKADAEFGKKLEDLQAQRWKWAGGIAAILGFIGILVAIIKPDLSLSSSPPYQPPQYQPQPQGQTFQAAPQGPQVIYYVTRPNDVPPGIPATPAPATLPPGLPR